MDVKGKIDAEMDSIAEKLEKAQKLKKFNNEQGATAEYEEGSDPSAPYSDKKVDESKPKITLPESAIKRKVKEKAEEKRKMNKSTNEMIGEILAKAEELGKEEFKKAVSQMAPEQQMIVGRILEKGRGPDKKPRKKRGRIINDSAHRQAMQNDPEYRAEMESQGIGPEHKLEFKKSEEGENMEELNKASQYDGPTEKPMPKPVKDLPQEEVKEGNQYEWGDRKDEKIMKENDDEVSHQGDSSPEGFEGQKIEDPTPQQDWEKQAMKKSMDELFDSEEGVEKLVDKALEKGLSIEELSSKLEKAGYAKMCKKCGNMMTEKLEKKKAKETKMAKSVQWNDWQSDALGATTKRGRNAHYAVDEEIVKSAEVQAERLSKGEFLNVESGEKLEKSADAKADINDIIEQGLDMDTDGFLNKSRKVFAKPQGAYNTQSFSDEDMAKSLNMSQEDADKILGKKTEDK